jgi:hypothetical protein
MACIGEVQRVALPAGRMLSIEEIQALVPEVSARMVVDHIEQHRQAIDMGEINQRLELIHFPLSSFTWCGRNPFSSSSRLTAAT